MRKWVEALRSGEFNQTKYVLHDDVGYCCLGVACEVYARETGKGSWGELVCSTDGSQEGYVFMNSGTTTLPEEVSKWFGIKSRTPRNPEILVDEKKVMVATLAELNDGTAEISRKSFDEIANIIEKSWL
jgi:hypothetical protein